MRSHDPCSVLLASGLTPRLLFFAPHPDDETLAGSVLLSSAAQYRLPIKVVFVTNGDNNPWPQRVMDRRWGINAAGRLEWGARRRKEALRALAVLGVTESQAEFWDFPDQGLTNALSDPTQRLRHMIDATLAEFRPTLIVAPSRLDLHPDHNALGLLVAIATWRWTESTPPVCLHYLVHGDSGAVRSGDFVVQKLSAMQRTVKRAALEQHATQLLLSRRRLMRYVDRNEYFIRDDALTTGVVWRHAAPAGWSTSVSKRTLNSTVAARVHCLGATGTASVHRVAAAEPDAGALHATRGEGCITLHSSGMDPLWLKLAAPWRFLDGSGWLRVAPAPPARTPSRRTCCVIPCYNVARFCGAVVRRAMDYADDVIAIDDGSSDATPHVLADLADRYPNLHVLVHPRNRGKGAALIAAFRYALQQVDFDTLVTLDADAQHDPRDIAPLVGVLHASGADLAVGARDCPADMPLRSRIGNTFMSAIVHMAFPNAPTDTQSGFRAHQREFVAYLAERLDGRRYETELQILVQALRRGPVVTVPISTVYLDNNRSSHFHPLRDSLRVLAALVKTIAVPTRR